MAASQRDTNGIRPGSAQRAIVIGAGIGGLLAARVLADTHDELLILERDALPAIGEQRKGVPQGQHAHGLMARGRGIIEELVPGITDDLLARGAMLGDTVAAARWFQTTPGRSRHGTSSTSSASPSRWARPRCTDSRATIVATTSVWSGCLTASCPSPMPSAASTPSTPKA
jgi:hypothetical protein